VVTCHFSKEFCTDQKNVSTNRMRGISLRSLQKSSANSKAFGVKQLGIYYFNKILKGELNKY
jgi:hypothetical protein